MSLHDTKYCQFGFINCIILTQNLFRWLLSCYEFLMFKVKRCWFQKTSENQYITAIKLTIDFENKIIYNFWNKNMFQWLFKSTFKQVWQVCFRIFLFFLTKFYFWQKVIQKDRIQQHLDQTNRKSNSCCFVINYQLDPLQ